jgi:hypothetical protein
MTATLVSYFALAGTAWLFIIVTLLLGGFYFLQAIGEWRRNRRSARRLRLACRSYNVRVPR